MSLESEEQQEQQRQAMSARMRQRLVERYQARQQRAMRPDKIGAILSPHTSDEGDEANKWRRGIGHVVIK